MTAFEELVLKYPWFLRINSSDGALEMFIDHHMLSSFRTCEAKFVEEILACQHPRSERYWSLEFGAWVHDCLDRFYNNFKLHGVPPVLDEWVADCIKLWDDYDLSYFKPDPLKLVKDYRTDEKKYRAFSGREGAAAFLIHYYSFYMGQRFRVVATEVSFGRRHEVKLGEFRKSRFKYWEGPNGESDYVVESWDPVCCYLTGRIDLLVDNTYKIGPVDHKTTAKFDGYESDDFDPHEGITGYIYTTNEILKTEFPDNPHKVCRDGWIFHIATDAGCEPRFKATLITKTPQQLEDYRLRQVSTCKRLLDVLLEVRVADWNTNSCNNIYNRPCPYRELHRQPPSQREGTLKQFYEVREPWNPEHPPSVRNLKKQQASQEITEPSSVKST